jgi:hypothetical protein
MSPLYLPGLMESSERGADGSRGPVTMSLCNGGGALLVIRSVVVAGAREKARRAEGRVGLTLLAWVLSSAPFAPVARADADLRCGTNLVRLGDLAGTVEEKCGAPTEKQHVETTLRGRSRTPLHLEGERWIYDRGATEFTRVLFFEQGRLFSIDVEGYGAG